MTTPTPDANAQPNEPTNGTTGNTPADGTSEPKPAASSFAASLTGATANGSSANGSTATSSSANGTSAAPPPAKPARSQPAAASSTAETPSARTAGASSPSARPDPADDKLIFPLGHYIGPFHPAEGAALRHHIVRVGWDTVRIPTQEDFEIWALCHGIAELSFGVRWTRTNVIEAAEELPKDYDVEGSLDRLLESGAIVEVADGTPEVVEFARSHRVQSLLLGLGNRDENPLLYGIGIPNVQPVVQVPVRDFELWQWGHVSDTLWDACELSAEAWRQAGATDAADTDTSQQVERSLRTLQILISHGAAYLDLPRRAAEREAELAGAESAAGQ